MAQRKPEEGEAEEVVLQQVEMFRTIYALCDVSPVTRRLRATHYACCLCHGRDPIWGLFSAATGNLMFFFDSRAGIQEHPHYRRKAWRVKAGGWTLTKVVAAMARQDKDQHLQEQRSGGAVPLPRRGT